MKHALPSLLFIALSLAACSTGDGPPADAKEARELMTGKPWAVKDVGFLETSFRQNKGEPFIYTFTCTSAANASEEHKAIREKYLKASLTLDANPNPNDGSGDVAHLEGLNLGGNQQYYFTSTQEENRYDRTIKLYVNLRDSTGAAMQYPYTLLTANGSKVVMLAPAELGARNLVLSLER